MKTEIKQKIEELETELQKLKEELNKPEKWQDGLVQPYKEEYYYIAGSSTSGFRIYSDLRSAPRKPEYALQTSSQAELVKEKMLLMQEMLAFAHVRNEGWKPDWEEESNKWGISIARGIPGTDRCWHNNSVVFGITVKSKEIAEEMLKIFGERIQKYYNEQY